MPPTTSSSDVDLVRDLEPTVVHLFDRHLTTSKPWMPHELVPWHRAAALVPGEPWDPERFPLPAAVRSALFVNLLTEDNLPYYFETIFRVFGDYDAQGAQGAEVWRAWARRWTAEEMRHAMVIRDYLIVTGALDPVALEEARMQQVSGGQVPHPASPADALVYVALQELATRLAHRNTGRLLDDEAGYHVMARVAADENLHYLFYRDLTTAAIAIDPSTVVLAIERQIREFEMPGTGIPDFAAHAGAIARAGIYDLPIHHGQILEPVVMKHWGLAALEGLSAEAEQARERTVAFIDRLGRIARRVADRRERVPASA